MLEQTHRHSFIASLLGIPHAVVCVNKMDLVNYDKKVYDKIVSDFKAFSSKLEIRDVQFVPISALNGDNVVNRSKNMTWYEGSTLLYHLENVHISSDYNQIDCRFPVQTVIRPHTKEHQDFRGFAGRIDGGIFKVGDKIKTLPTGFTSKIKSIYSHNTELNEAYTPMSVNIVLEDEIDINTLHRIENIESIQMNDIARISIRTSKPLFFDSYKKNRRTGSLILIDEQTNETVGAGMIINK